MSIDRTNPRNPAYEVDALFVDRWSPRSFVEGSLTDAEVNALLEAAHWAPSCMNEQPWRFWVAHTEDARERFLPTLVERNQLWARRASLLLYIGARKNFGTSKSLNRQAMFDTGAAWMSLALQARRLGLYAHGMAGFDRDKAYALTGVSPDDIEIIAAIAVGRRGDPEALSEDQRKRESPSMRKGIEELVKEI
jgi:nitroreductase